ncbi:helix-turn-helix domain-containing protein [Paenibacillus doosanensis]|uniref:helix-turn-helix domain-containing protein n=1 Tax=Paenibacillus doosanensis TaxID=1229154 RepID=UPI0021803289|nr:helix-turn-helix domain-containing protein [Paenibacillus doosanensis]MCS7462596.1 helix-turn-helix domain-containing protein [Paenibacillus doosanensis]
MPDTLKLRLTHWGSRFYGGKGTHYRKILILILLIASIPGLITGALIYWFVGGTIENELLQLHKNQIVKRAEHIDGQFANMELAMSHGALDTKFDYSLKETDFYTQFAVTRDISKTIVLMQGAMPLAKSLDLYIDGKMPAHFNPEFSLIDIQSDEWKQFKSITMKAPNVFWTMVLTNTKAGTTTDLALVHKIPGGVSEPFGLMVARLDRDNVVSLLKTVAPYDEGEAFMMQEDGTELISTGGGSNRESSLIEAVKKEVLGRGGVQQMSFLFKWDKNTYSVSAGALERIDSRWIYVSIAPISAIKKPIVFLSQAIVLVSCAGLLLAAVLAWIASRRIYSPLHQLVRLLSGGKLTQGNEFELIERHWEHMNRESLELQSKLEQQLPQVKEGFLLQLIQGYLSAYSEEDLIERMHHYGWNTEQRQYIVLYIQLVGMSQLDTVGRFSHGDEGLITFAAANMAEEIARERFDDCHVINFHNLTAGLLISIPQGDSCQAELKQLSEALMQTINRILKMQVTITLSKATTQIRKIPLLFEEAKLALSYRNFGNENQIIDLDAFSRTEEEQPFQYPFSLERDIIQAMRMGQESEAESHIRAFMETLAADGVKEMDVQQGVMNLLGSLEHAMMQSGMNPNQLFKSANMFEQLGQLREPEQIEKWFVHKVIGPFIAAMESRADFQLKKMIEQAMLYIQAHYMNDISLDSCAEHCGTNAFVLSRTFKQVSGKNFIDYLTDLRMEKAKEMLRNSDLKINEVSERVGYQHSYFNRIFKKYEGVTPSQYRDMSRKS